jgi:hypothetical protein
MDAARPSRPSITDSPWYWLYLFATAGLLALLLIGPKFTARQAQLERNYQGRQRALQHRAGEAPHTPLSTPKDTAIRLGPLYTVLLVLLLAGWSGLWLRHVRQKKTSLYAAPEMVPAPSPPEKTASKHAANPG